MNKDRKPGGLTPRSEPRPTSTQPRTAFTACTAFMGLIALMIFKSDGVARISAEITLRGAKFKWHEPKA